MSAFKKFFRGFVAFGAFAFGIYATGLIARFAWPHVYGRVSNLVVAGGNQVGTPAYQLNFRPWNVIMTIVTLLSIVVSIYARRLFVLVAGINPDTPEFTGHYRAALRHSFRTAAAFLPALLALAGSFTLLERVFQNAIENQVHELFLLFAFIGFWTLIAFAFWLSGNYMMKLLNKHLPHAGSGLASQTLMLVLLTLGLLYVRQMNHWMAEAALLAFGLWGVLSLLGALVRIFLFEWSWIVKKAWHRKLASKTWGWVKS